VNATQPPAAPSPVRLGRRGEDLGEFFAYPRVNRMFALVSAMRTEAICMAINGLPGHRAQIWLANKEARACTANVPV
jgi:hypothetical protein